MDLNLFKDVRKLQSCFWNKDTQGDLSLINVQDASVSQNNTYIVYGSSIMIDAFIFDNILKILYIYSFVS